MWAARNKNDLIIEVWEKLDCENIGRAELEAISTVVADRYGASAVDPPMVIARLLADEGADLRHSEIMDLHVERASDRPYDAAFRDIVKIDGFTAVAGMIRRLENLRLKYSAENDKTGLRHVMETARRARKAALGAAETAADGSVPISNEAANWIAVWLENPAVFENWLELRTASPDFTRIFGEMK